MGITSYHSVGEIFALVANGTRRDLLLDGQGSVLATINNTGAVVSKYVYKPYGSQIGKGIITIVPQPFLWKGGYGYRQNGPAYSDTYVRARHYGSTIDSWTTVDPLWPDERAYVYLSSNPLKGIDYFGTDQYSDYSWNYSGDYNERIEQRYGIMANIQLPSKCNIPCKGGYVNFYIGMNRKPLESSSRWEGGISIGSPVINGKPRHGWAVFLNPVGLKANEYEALHFLLGDMAGKKVQIKGWVTEIASKSKVTITLYGDGHMLQSVQTGGKYPKLCIAADSSDKSKIQKMVSSGQATFTDPVFLGKGGLKGKPWTTNYGANNVARRDHSFETFTPAVSFPLNNSLRVKYATKVCNASALWPKKKK